MTDKAAATLKHYVALSPAEWQLVMAALGELPGKITRSTMNAIEAQMPGQPAAEPASGRKPKAPKG